jgi:hypothetical protein
MMGKPILEPGKRSCLGDTGSAIKSAGGMIHNENVTGLTVDTFIGSGTSGILGLLTSKCEVNGEALPRDGRFASGMMARGVFLELGRKAGGALIQNGVLMGEFGDTINVFMRMVEVGITNMVEALVPKKALGASVQLVEVKLLDE